MAGVSASYNSFLQASIVEDTEDLKISAQPVRPFAGNNAYSVKAGADETKTRWGFSIYSDGYTKKGEDGEVLPVDTLIVNTESKRLTVMKAMNALDQVNPRMKMRQVLKECWTMAGLEPAELKEVLGWRLDNANMNTAISKCRKSLGLETSASFEVTSTESAAARKACWETLGKTIFSSAIRGAIRDFDINKQLIKVEVDYGDEYGKGDYNHVYYHFS
ncbi:hypothetical protein C8034_v004081 [Colletotrichum sidae]|uniref:Uncharacterized protein n=1 Tax=Colletotrichum sidae TaxID=1347389 RepID=A0A4R8TAD4_9PEZI|nr:hypothetical protein C8034_v004081 [Colletotrichum sidae]